MASRNHRHRFDGLWWHFGRFGRQDVHVHSCGVRTQGDPEGREFGCDRVLIGDGRECDGDPVTHHRETLDG